MKRLLPIFGLLAMTAGPVIAQPAEPVAPPAAGVFPDLPPDHWAFDAVRQLAILGILTGYPDGTFGGRRAVTRYEAATALQRLNQQVETTLRERLAAPPAAAAAAPVVTPPAPAAPVAPSAELSELRREQEQLSRDVSWLQEKFATLRVEITGLRREVNDLREMIGEVEPRRR